jgi:hypothetical protein
MSKRKRKRYIERPSIHGQRAARKTAATTNKIRSGAVARTNENSAPIETAGEIFANGWAFDLAAMLPMMKSNSYGWMRQPFRSRLVSR